MKLRQKKLLFYILYLDVEKNKMIYKKTSLIMRLVFLSAEKFIVLVVEYTVNFDFGFYARPL